MRNVKTANGKTRSHTNTKKSNASQSPHKSLKSDSRNSQNMGIKRVGGGYSLDRSKDMIQMSREDSVETVCKCSVNKYKTEYSNTLDGGNSFDRGCPAHSEYSIERPNDNSMMVRE